MTSRRAFDRMFFWDRFGTVAFLLLCMSIAFRDASIVKALHPWTALACLALVALSIKRMQHYRKKIPQD
ncbi:MAG: hypothetical protein HZA81_00645 [Candidatus Taylorbacteria bacterium]|nr:hypothetical protein [Candidatus Taylorbacteria bacterium]